ncbi:tetratricopeptide repeat protein [Flavilitoribacter nigricans]|uniref:Peptidase M48 domain-containing protein n=1 Tax=Flavilitoribacter nigricans (strain ATCC 23147 / DSM 23189 / NBRC 102662 / NCIMB 1420 / SS-2) TaxID=1122177 RepID=A0A2D0NH08_FLAN2|nr:hypothetical protein [Flavilitoribacter nigricans]PHN07767.1 hypothetical protein CRP01_04815 [Flavilitoribacter nigricans DSM 23189 = NBRC 102662]
MRLRQILSILLTTTLLPAFLSGQTSFEFIAKSVTESQDTRFTSGPKYERALKVYNKLADARGDRRFPLPAFVMSSSEQNVAYLEGDGLSIGLEEKAYDLCMSLGEKEGENAMAALLGHELTHFYEKHQWRRGFADAYIDLKVGRELKSTTDLYKVNCETQSDYLGGFLAYSAGYPVYAKLPDFYDLIYQQYRLPDTMSGYASKDDRKALAVKSLEKLNDLVEVFEMANLMTAIGRYDDARAFYKHILTQYQGREIYNNLGVLTVLSAITNYFTDSELKYRMPVELDLDFAGGGTRDGFSERVEKRRKLLQEAIQYFDNATSMDPDYAPAFLNKACAYFLLEDPANLERARFYAGVEAKQKAAAMADKYPRTALDAEVLLALLEEKAGNKTKAISMLTAIKDQSSVANYNLFIMNGQAPPRGRKEDGPEDESIDGIDQNGVYNFTRNNRREKKEQELFGQIDFRAWQDMGELRNSKIYVCKPPTGSAMSTDVYIHLTKPGYPGETFDGYKIGTARKEITDEYGEPNFSLPLTAGEIMVYEEVMFVLDGDKKVTRFANYFFK